MTIWTHEITGGEMMDLDITDHGWMITRESSVFIELAHYRIWDHIPAIFIII